MRRVLMRLAWVLCGGGLGLWGCAPADAPGGPTTDPSVSLSEPLELPSFLRPVQAMLPVALDGTSGGRDPGSPQTPDEEDLSPEVAAIRALLADTEILSRLDEMDRRMSSFAETFDEPRPCLDETMRSPAGDDGWRLPTADVRAVEGALQCAEIVAEGACPSCALVSSFGWDVPAVTTMVQVGPEQSWTATDDCPMLSMSETDVLEDARVAVRAQAMAGCGTQASAAVVDVSYASWTDGDSASGDQEHGTLTRIFVSEQDDYLELHHAGVEAGAPACGVRLMRRGGLVYLEGVFRESVGVSYGDYASCFGRTAIVPGHHAMRDSRYAVSTCLSAESLEEVDMMDCAASLLGAEYFQVASYDALGLMEDGGLPMLFGLAGQHTEGVMAFERETDTPPTRLSWPDDLYVGEERVPPALLFATGFEGSVSLTAVDETLNATVWQYFSGQDTETGFSFPPSFSPVSDPLLINNIAGYNNEFPTVHYMQNALVETTGPQEQVTTALEMRMMDYPAAHHAPQNDLLFLWENPGASDGVVATQEPGPLYIRYWLRPSPDIYDALEPEPGRGYGRWHLISELKAGAGANYRYQIFFRSGPNDTERTYRVVADSCRVIDGANRCGSPEHWSYVIPLPEAHDGSWREGQWMPVEIFVSRDEMDPASGRFVFAIHGDLIFDSASHPDFALASGEGNRFWDDDMTYQSFWILQALYGLATVPHSAMIDDLEFWDGIPCRTPPCSAMVLGR